MKKNTNYYDVMTSLYCGLLTVASEIISDKLLERKKSGLRYLGEGLVAFATSALLLSTVKDEKEDEKEDDKEEE